MSEFIAIARDVLPKALIACAVGFVLYALALFVVGLVLAVFGIIS